LLLPGDAMLVLSVMALMFEKTALYSYNTFFIFRPTGISVYGIQLDQGPEAEL